LEPTLVVLERAVEDVALLALNRAEGRAAIADGQSQVEHEERLPKLWFSSQQA
jgi:hypothetical protein